MADLSDTAATECVTGAYEIATLIARAPGDLELLRRLVHPDDVAFVSRRVEAALQGPHDYDAEFRMIRGDGSVRRCAVRAIVVRDNAGKAVRAVGVDTDVTENHDILRRTLETEARLQLAMASASAGSWEYAIDRDEFIASDRALSLHGLPPGTPITSRRALDAVLDDDRSKVEEALRTTIATKAPFRQELRARQTDGSIRWLLSQAELHVVGAQRRLVGLVQDITQRKNAEIELLRNMERFALAIGNSPTVVFEQDLDLRYTWIHNARLGHSAESVLGKTDAALMDEASASATEALKRQVISTGTPLRREVAVAAPGRPTQYYDLSVEPRRDRSGLIVGVICAASDITARRNVEEALRDSEARYRSAMTLGRIASWETNYVTGQRLWTPEGLALFGLDLRDGTGTVGGETDEFLSALHPEDRHLYDAYLDIEKERDSYPAEYRILRPDGQTRWMSGYGRVVDRDADGRPLRMINVVTDVTEKKAAEQHTQFLIRELSRLASIVESSDDAIVSNDLSGVITSWNGGAQRIYGYSSEEMIGQLVSVLIPPSRQGEEAGISARLRRGERIDPYETVRRRKDGSFVDISLTVSHIRNAAGEVVAASMIARDITDRRRGALLAGEIAAMEERLRLATEVADIGWWDVEEGNGRLSWPPRVKAMFGISADAPVTMDDFYNGLHPDDRRRVAAAYAGAVDASRRELYDVEYRTIGKEDGVLRWVAAKGRGVFDGTGKCKRTIGTAIDITERKRAQEESLARLQEETELRDQFIAVLGHDLKNPLASVAAATRLLGRRPERAAELTAQVERSVLRMSDLIDNILDLARGRLGGGFAITRDSKEPLEPVLLHVIDELKGVHPERDVEIDVDLREPINCDRQRIGQLLSNLLGNAFIHGAPTASIQVRARAAGGQLELSVTNPGEPIDLTDLNRLFEPFFRGRARGNREGLGLGLYICSEIAKAHGGAMSVLSEEGKTTFTLRMPTGA